MLLMCSYTALEGEAAAEKNLIELLIQNSFSVHRTSPFIAFNLACIPTLFVAFLRQSKTVQNQDDFGLFKKQYYHTFAAISTSFCIDYTHIQTKIATVSVNSFIPSTSSPNS